MMKNVKETFRIITTDPKDGSEIENFFDSFNEALRFISMQEAGKKYAITQMYEYFGPQKTEKGEEEKRT